MALKNTSVAIIGAGPSGLLLAAILQRTGIDYIHIEGGQIGQTLLSHSRRSHMRATQEALHLSASPAGLADLNATLEGVRAFVQRNHLRVQTYERVTHLTQRGTAFHLRSRQLDEQIRTYRAQQVILATGNCSAFQDPAFVGCRSHRVATHLQHPHQYFQQRLLIVGDTIDALAAAEECRLANATVMLCHPVGILPPLRQRIEQAARRGIFEYFPDTELLELNQQAAHLRQSDGQHLIRQVDRVLVQQGHRPDYQLLHQIGVGLQGPDMVPAYDPASMQTNIPGLFVLGSLTIGKSDALSGRGYRDQVQRLARTLCTAYQLDAKPEMSSLPMVSKRRQVARTRWKASSNEGLGARY